MDWFQQNVTSLIAPGSAILAAVVAGGFAILGAWSNNRQNNQRFKLQIDHEKSKENKKLFLDKGEELYVCIEGWTHVVFAHMLTEEKCIRGDITLKQKIELLKDYADSSAYSRLQVLLPIYFSELGDRLQECRKLAHLASQNYEDFMNGTITSEIALSLHQSHGKLFDHASNNLRLELQKMLLTQVKG